MHHWEGPGERPRQPASLTQALTRRSVGGYTPTCVGAHVWSKDAERDADINKGKGAHVWSKDAEMDANMNKGKGALDLIFHLAHALLLEDMSHACEFIRRNHIYEGVVSRYEGDVCRGPRHRIRTSRDSQIPGAGWRR